MVNNWVYRAKIISDGEIKTLFVCYPRLIKTSCPGKVDRDEISLFDTLKISQDLPVERKIEEIWIGSIFGWLFGPLFVVMLLEVSNSSHQC